MKRILAVQMLLVMALGASISACSAYRDYLSKRDPRERLRERLGVHNTTTTPTIEPALLDNQRCSGVVSEECVHKIAEEGGFPIAWTPDALGYTPYSLQAVGKNATTSQGPSVVTVLYWKYHSVAGLGSIGPDPARRSDKPADVPSYNPELETREEVELDGMTYTMVTPKEWDTLYPANDVSVHWYRGNGSYSLEIDWEDLKVPDYKDQTLQFLRSIQYVRKDGAVAGVHD